MAQCRHLPFLVLISLLLAGTIPAYGIAAEEIDNFFNAHDVMCPGYNMELGNCYLETDGTLACKWEKEYIAGPKLQYDIMHFTSKQEARRKFESRASYIKDTYEYMKGPNPGIRYEIREFTSKENYIVLETRTTHLSGDSASLYGYLSGVNYLDTIVMYLSFGGYTSEQEFEADKGRIKTCIEDSLKKKIPGLTSGGFDPPAVSEDEQKATADWSPPRQPSPVPAEETGPNLELAGPGPWTGEPVPVSDLIQPTPFSEFTRENPVSELLGSGGSVIGEERIPSIWNIIHDLTRLFDNLFGSRAPGATKPDTPFQKPDATMPVPPV